MVEQDAIDLAPRRQEKKKSAESTGLLLLWNSLGAAFLSRRDEVLGWLRGGSFGPRRSTFSVSVMRDCACERITDRRHFKMLIMRRVPTSKPKIKRDCASRHEQGSFVHAKLFPSVRPATTSRRRKGLNVNISRTVGLLLLPGWKRKGPLSFWVLTPVSQRS